MLRKVGMLIVIFSLSRWTGVNSELLITGTMLGSFAIFLGFLYRKKPKFQKMTLKEGDLDG